MATADVLDDTRLGWRYRLRADATATLDGTPPFVATATAAVPLPGAVYPEIVRLLQQDWRDEVQLAGEVLAHCGEQSAFTFQKALRALGRGGWLETELVSDGVPLARLQPLGHAPAADTPTDVPPLPARLSRFAALRPVDGTLRLETPRSALAVVLLDPRAAALVAALAAPLSDVTVAGLGGAAASALLRMLAAAGALAETGEDDELRLAQWSAPDLDFHAASRMGRRAGGYGGTYRLAQRFPALPAVPERRPAAVVLLPRPDLAAAAAADPPLTTVLEQRHSTRRHDDDAPITLGQLGELLYRTCRTRSVVAVDGDEVVDRPYPAGGSLHELEVYPVVTRCDGLDVGLWHYSSLEHELHHVAGLTPAVQAVLAEARLASTMPTDPQVLLVVTARFGRLMRKYDAVAYALTLKHVGVLYQTLYLVATAMGLAACGLGGGNADRFAAASGLDYYAESSVGEFVLGSRMPSAGGAS